MVGNSWDGCGWKWRARSSNIIPCSPAHARPPLTVLRAPPQPPAPQALTYDFQFYTSPVPVSVAPVVLSVGRSVMKDALPLTLPLNTTRPLPDVEGVRAAAAAAGPAVMGAVRAYLGAVAELPYAIDDAMSESLQVGDGAGTGCGGWAGGGVASKLWWPWATLPPCAWAHQPLGPCGVQTRQHPSGHMPVCCGLLRECAPIP